MSKSRGVPIEGIVGGPLLAAVQANGMMSHEQSQFLLDYCFEKSAGTYHPIMVTMSLQSAGLTDEADQPVATTRPQQLLHFQLPLISILPLSSLAVQEVEVKFDMEVTSYFRQEKGEKEEVNARFSKNSPVHLHGNLHGRKNREEMQKESRSSHLELVVKAAPLPLPLGLTTILDLYTKAIQPIDASMEAPHSA